MAKKDKEEIFKLIDAVNRGDKLHYSITEEWLDYVMDEAGEGLMVGYRGDLLVGLGTCMINPEDSNQATFNVVIHPEMRNQGFGTALYHGLLEYARQKHVQTVEAYVKKRLENAVRFALTKGFQVVLYSWQMELSLKKTGTPYETMKSVAFRRTEASDGKAYASIVYECFGDSVEEDSLRRLLKDPSIAVYLLENQGEIIGSVAMQLRRNLSLGYIYDVAVLKEHRGQGLASYLLKQAKIELEKAGMKKASLLVAGENKAALRLYEKEGFQITDTDFVMQKTLNPL